MRRREMRGAADNLAATFISRNNDVAGYWALGMLYAVALAHQTMRMEFDLLNATAQPDGDVARAVAEYYSAYLTQRLDNLVLSAAQIDIVFAVASSEVLTPQLTRGKPFRMSVTLVSDTGRSFSASRTGHCDPHSSLDLRSMRRNGLAKLFGN